VNGGDVAPPPCVTKLVPTRLPFALVLSSLARCMVRSVVRMVQAGPRACSRFMRSAPSETSQSAGQGLELPSTVFVCFFADRFSFVFLFP